MVTSLSKIRVHKVKNPPFRCFLFMSRVVYILHSCIVQFLVHVLLLKICQLNWYRIQKQTNIRNMHAKISVQSSFYSIPLLCKNLHCQNLKYIIYRRENEIGETHPLTHLHNLYNLLFISIFACKLNPYLFDFIFRST